VHGQKQFLTGAASCCFEASSDASVVVCMHMAAQLRLTGSGQKKLSAQAMLVVMT
jgi:hypothetical protein